MSLFLSASLCQAAQFGPGLNRIYLYRQGVIRRDNAPSAFFPAVETTGSISVIGTGDPSAVVRLGGTIRTYTGEYFTASIPVDALPALAGENSVGWLDTGPRVYPYLDKAWTYANLSTPYAAGYTGSDVIVGFVDSGIDVDHPDFKSSNGLTRIIYLWDQSDTTTGSSPSGYDYGREWTKTEIDLKQCTEADTEGHGTHVAGIACGTGSASGGFYRGMAPGAGIIFVATDFSLTGILDGVAYILQKSVELGKPCVINLSLGMQAGSHTANDPYNKAFDSLLDTYGHAGHIIVWAAGNDGDADVHAIQNSAYSSFPVMISNGTTALSFVYSNDQVLPVAVLDKLGNPVSPFTTQQTLSASDYYIENDNYPNGEKFVYVQLAPGTKTVWKVVFSNQNLSVIDGYVSDNSEGGTRFVNAATNGSLSSFAAQSGAFAVAAIITKTNFINYQGLLVRPDMPGNTLYDIAPFSSRGPTRDGQYKPDIAAPGSVIVSVRSSAIAANVWDVNDNYTVMLGTSMAAPAVTGVIALMLEKEPSLTAEQVRTRLVSGARGNFYKTDPGTWDGAFGYGILSAAFVATNDAVTAGLDVSLYNTVVNFSSGTDGEFVMHFRSNSSQIDQTVTIQIFDLSGNLIKDYGSDTVTGVEVKEYVWDGTDRFDRTSPAGIYIVRIQVGDTVERHRILVIR